jgi:hypothetical protein
VISRLPLGGMNFLSVKTGHYGPLPDKAWSERNQPLNFHAASGGGHRPARPNVLYRRLICFRPAVDMAELPRPQSPGLGLVNPTIIGKGAMPV